VQLGDRLRSRPDQADDPTLRYSQQPARHGGRRTGPYRGEQNPVSDGDQVAGDVVEPGHRPEDRRQPQRTGVVGRVGDRLDGDGPPWLVVRHPLKHSGVPGAALEPVARRGTPVATHGLMQRLGETLDHQIHQRVATVGIDESGHVRLPDNKGLLDHDVVPPIVA
jgi:hypothetical protein